MTSCPDPETLAAYVDRRVTDTDALEGHLAACATCRAEVVALTDLVVRIRPRRVRGFAVAAAAAILILGLVVATSRVETPPPPHVYVPPKPESKPEPEPPKPEEPPRPDRVVLATLQDVEGQVFIELKGRRSPAASGSELSPGHLLFTINGTATVAYPDGTIVAVGASTWINRLTEADGKRIALSEGTLRATVAKQPEGKPLVITTPNGDARVVGTVFRLTAEKTRTHLEVEEGTVQLKGVDVTAGHVASTDSGARPFASLRGHWKLDEGSGRIAADATGLGNDGRLKDKTEWSAGKIGGGVECRKAGFFVHPFHPGGGPTTGYTAALWIHHDELDAWQDVYFSTPGFAMIREGNLERGRIRVTFRTNETSPNLAVNGVVEPRQWLHLALTWDGETARLYRNGREVGSGRVTGLMEPPKSMSFGAEVDGRMDDVRFYRRALTPAEIDQVMHGKEVR